MSRPEPTLPNPNVDIRTGRPVEGSMTRTDEQLVCDVLARIERAERDCSDLHMALHEAIKRIKHFHGRYDDLLAVLKRTSTDE